jgi:hypothetical protein
LVAQEVQTLVVEVAVVVTMLLEVQEVLEL